MAFTHKYIFDTPISSIPINPPYTEAHVEWLRVDPVTLNVHFSVKMRTADGAEPTSKIIDIDVTQTQMTNFVQAVLQRAENQGKLPSGNIVSE